MSTAVSVLVPSWNAGRWVVEAVESALAQTFRDIEVLVFDDASTDDTPERLAALSDPRLVVRRNAKNLGFTGNVGHALDHARGRFVMVLGADDVLDATFLAEAMAILADPAVAAVHGRAVWITEAGTPYALQEGEWPARSSGADAFVRCFTDGFCFSTLVLRRDAIRRPLPASWGNINDSHLFLSGCLAGDVGFIAEPLCRYRVHQESVSLGMYADGSLFRDHIFIAHEAFAWPEAAAIGVARRKGEALAGIVRSSMAIAHLTRLKMPPAAFARLLGEFARAAPGAMLEPKTLARLAFCALPRPAIRALRARRLSRRTKVAASC